MTHRLYYTNAYTTEFTAAVTEQTVYAGQPAVVLTESYFYPASGGQPADTGWLGETAVLDVQIRPQDGAILHILAAEWAGGELAHGRVAWPRRWDFMQQHTGQHILSQAFLRTAEAETVGFHLNEATCTIDVDRPDLTDAELATAEALANQTVWHNLPVTAQLVDWSQLAQFPLRKQPTKDYAQLRLVAIGDFDLSACGGTHVAHTGEVGLIKIIKREKRGEKTRLEFVCGGRATADYGHKLALIQGLVAELTTSPDELLSAVQKIRAENKQLQREQKATQAQLLAYEAQALASQFVPLGTGQLLTAVFTDKSAADLRTLANLLADEASGRVVLFGLAGEKSFFLFKRHVSAPGDMSAALRAALLSLGAKSGGGTAVQAQGGGLPATAEQIQHALSQATQTLQ